MSLEEFGRLVAAGMQAKGIGQGKLAVYIGVLPDGRTLDATQVRHILQGTRRSLDSQLVQRIAEVLDLDALEAHRLAGTWPPHLEPEDLRDISERAAARKIAAVGRVAKRKRGRDLTAAPSPFDQGNSTMGTSFTSPAKRALDPAA
jgi:transcriptional regulator with XRE-family HTH domain